MRQAVVYARVSSKEQEKEGFSIPAQLKLLREYALSDGIRVVEEYVDVETAEQAGRPILKFWRISLTAHFTSSYARIIARKCHLDWGTQRQANPPGDAYVPGDSNCSE